MDKKIIGIVCSKTVTTTPPFTHDIKSGVCVDYIAAVLKAKGIPLQIPMLLAGEDIEPYIHLCDGFLFPGGPDMHPRFYNEDAHQGLGQVHPELDAFQIKLIRAVLKNRKPVLGICRGAQILNVALGGNLYQDIGETATKLAHYMDVDRSDVSHKIQIERGSLLARLLGEELWVNSFHHQAINRLGTGLKVIARAKDGVIEAVTLEDHPFAIGLQWHPEMLLTETDEMLPVFEELVKQAGKSKEGGNKNE